MNIHMINDMIFVFMHWNLIVKFFVFDKKIFESM